MRGALAALLLLGLCGCAAWQGKSLPGPSLDSLPKSRVTGVDYEISRIHSIDNDPWMLHSFPARLDRQLEKAFTHAAPGIGRAPLHLILAIDTTGEEGPGLLTLASFFTATLIPSYAPLRINLRVEARLDDKFLASYDYSRGMRAWYGVIFIPLLFTANSWRAVAGTLTDEMIANLIFDLTRDIERKS